MGENCGQFPGEREGPQSRWDPLLSVPGMDSPDSAPKPSPVNPVPPSSEQPHLPDKLSSSFGSLTVPALNQEWH